MSLTYDKTDSPIVYDRRTNRIIYYDKDDTESKITKYEGHIELIPPTGQKLGEENDIIAGFGKSGCGKSYTAKQYAVNYRKMHPTYDIYILSQSKEDGLDEDKKVFTALMSDGRTRYDKFLRIKRIEVDKKFMDKKWDVAKDFKKCLIILDDFLYFQGENEKETKEIKNKIYGIVRQIINLGRKAEISCYITSHLLYERSANDFYQNLYGEMNKLLFGVDKVNRNQINHVAKTYMGLSENELRLMHHFDKNSHYICINKYPMAFISENRIQLLR